MMKLKAFYVGILFLAGLTASCEYGRQAEEKLSEFNSKAEDLDGLINDGIEKVTDLDSILPETSKKLKEADSVIKDTSSTLDSLKQTVNDIQNIFN